jgi:hypothetical protein
VGLKLISVSHYAVYGRHKKWSLLVCRETYSKLKNSEQCTAEEIIIVKNIYSFPFTSK